MTVTPDAPSLARIAHAAGRAIMPHFGSAEARLKSDSSPVTAADEAAEAVILAALGERWPDIPVIAEELAAAGRLPEIGARFLLVDPLDGTREFIAGRDEFTVNIALVEVGRPVAGVVLAPASGRMFAADAAHGVLTGTVPHDEEFRDAALSPCEPPRREAGAPLRAVASRSHRSPETDEWLNARGITDVVAAGSSLKLCALVEGRAEVYPRLGRTMEWDIAAGQAVLEAAGGRVLEAESGAPLRYGKAARGYDNPPFIAWAAGVRPS